MSYTEIVNDFMGGDTIALGKDGDSAEFVLVVEGPDHYETCIRFDEVEQAKNTTQFYRRIRPRAGTKSHRVKTGQIEKINFGPVGKALTAIANGRELSELEQ